MRKNADELRTEDRLIKAGLESRVNAEDLDVLSRCRYGAAGALDPSPNFLSIS